MSEELISISVDELKEAEQELKEFVAEKHLHYLSACEDTLSREYKITLRDKKALFDKVMKSGKTTEEIDKENFDNLMKGIHFTTEQICNYIANPEYYKENGGSNVLEGHYIGTQASGTQSAVFAFVPK